MIKAFLFDYGGVMTAGGKSGELGERLGKILGIPPEQAYLLLANAWDDFAVGEISEEKLWQGIEASSGIRVLPEQRKIWDTWQHTNVLPEMRQLVRELKAKGYSVGLVANVIPNTLDEINRHGGYDDFEFLILSCEVGYAKPDPEIYKLAFDYLPGIDPSEMMFIDDQERFLVPAKQLGMQILLATNPSQVIADVRELTLANHIS
ncbi:MAG: HAD family phosphatase [Candidatus Saccharimonadales bacterium]